MDTLSRRRLLMGLGAALVGLGTWEGVRRVWPGPPAAGFRVLDAESVGICRVLVDRFVGPQHAEVPVLEELDKTLEALPEVGELWKRLPRVLEQSTLLDGHFSSFTGLSAEEQEAVLQAWGASTLLPRRQIFHGLRDLILSHYYFQAGSWPAIGYGGPWVGRYDLQVHPARFSVEVEG